MLRVVATFPLPALPAQETNTCLTNTSFQFLEDGLYKALPKVQPCTQGAVLQVLELVHKASFMDVATVVLGASSLIEQKIASLLILRGHVLALQQIDLVVRYADQGNETGMETNGYPNFSFVPNSCGGVSVVQLSHGRDWEARIFPLKGGGKWNQGTRFLVLDTDNHCRQ